SCASSLQFMIVQPQDVTTVVCQLAPDPNPSSLTAAQQQTLAALRSVLPASQWYVDLTNHCVVPKGNAASASCYGDRTGLPPIDYASGSCVPFNPGTGTVGTCPEWVSICTRQ